MSRPAYRIIYFDNPWNRAKSGFYLFTPERKLLGPYTTRDQANRTPK